MKARRLCLSRLACGLIAAAVLLVSGSLALADDPDEADLAPSLTADYRGWSNWHAEMEAWHSSWGREDLAEWEGRAAAHDAWLAEQDERWPSVEDEVGSRFSSWPSPADDPPGLEEDPSRFETTPWHTDETDG